MNRKTKIIEIVEKEGNISVKDLAKILGVSQVTIRKELTEVDEKNLIQREHGYAMRLNKNRIDNRIAVNYATKLTIANLACEHITDGEIIMMESGSTNTLLAGVIASRRKNVTIITNSIYIANYLRDNQNISIILLGGLFQKEPQVNTGPLTRWCAQQFSVDKIFVGVDGFDRIRGFSAIDLDRTETVRDMAKSAKKVCVVTDSSKFNGKSTVQLFGLDEVCSVYTDSQIPKEDRETLEKAGVKVFMTQDETKK